MGGIQLRVDEAGGAKLICLRLYYGVLRMFL